MPRRVKVLFLVVLAFTIGMLLYTSHLRQTHTRDSRTIQDFYHKTKEALERGRSGYTVVDSTSGKTKGQIPIDKDADGDVDEDDAKLAQEMAGRLKAAEQQAKDLANAKSPNKPDRPSSVVGVGSSASGQNKKTGEPAAEEVETEEEHAVEQELDRILKKSPVIIFSKTYCPYSKRAKGVLLEKYVIDPAPYVVELDQHPLGPQIQTRLANMTGRKTVPNILVNGKSIGGSDDIAELEKNKALVDKIKSTKSTGGKWIDMKERFAQGAA